MTAPFFTRLFPSLLTNCLVVPGFFLFAGLLSACHNPQLSARQQALDTVHVSARNNAMDIFRTSSPRIWDIVNTTVTLRFDFEKKQADGDALLQVMAYTRPQDTLVLDAKSMDIHRVALKSPLSEALQPLPYTYDGKQLKIDVSRVPFGNLDIKSSQFIRIEYTAKPYAQPATGSSAIAEGRGLYFINTDHAIPGKPVQIWTQGETESNSHWIPTIDKPNQRSTFTISLVVPDSMTTLSNGHLASRKPLANGMRMDTWAIFQPIQVYAAMFAIGRFDIVRDSWQNNEGQSFEVSYYVEPKYAPNAHGMFRYTPEMMTYFSKATGVSYPWTKYSQVVVRDYVSGAMENTTATLFGEFANKDRRQLLDESNEDVVSHELFHQWFGDYVTCESWSHITLNESFASFGELLWRRYKHGRASADEHAWGDLQSYLQSARLNDPPLVRFHYRNREDVFDRVSYQKGACILRYIESLISDTLMSRSMETYLRANAQESAEADNWRLALERITGLDWRPFFNQWYYRGGHPVLQLRYAYNDAAHKMSLTVRQQSAPDSNYLYDLPVKTAVIYEGQAPRIEHWRINRREQQYQFPADAQGRYPLVIVDADHVLPAMIDEEKPMKMWLSQLKLSNDYISKVMAVNAAMRNDAQSLAPSVLAAGLADTIGKVRLYTLQQIAGLKRQSARDVLLTQVRLMSATGNNQERAAAYDVLGKWKDRNELHDMIVAVSDSSYLVSGAALGALSSLVPDTAYALAKEVLKQHPRSLLEAAVWTAISNQGKAEDLAFFQQKAIRAYGRQKIALAQNVALLAKATTDDSVFAHSLALIQKMTADEAIGGYRFAIGSLAFGLAKEYRDGKNAWRMKAAQETAQSIQKLEHDEDNLSKYRQIANSK